MIWQMGDKHCIYYRSCMRSPSITGKGRLRVCNNVSVQVNVKIIICKQVTLYGFWSRFVALDFRAENANVQFKEI